MDSPSLPLVRLVIAARTTDQLAKTRDECLQGSTHVHTVTADVAKETDCQAIVNKTVEEFGGVDILILNAAYSPSPQWFADYEGPVSVNTLAHASPQLCCVLYRLTSSPVCLGECTHQLPRTPLTDPPSRAG